MWRGLVAALLAGLLLAAGSLLVEDRTVPPPPVAVAPEDEEIEPGPLNSPYQPARAKPGALRSALRQARAASSPAFRGPWVEAAKGPLTFDSGSENPYRWGDVAGRVSAIVSDPTGETVLLGDSHGGVYVSRDRGQTYKDVSGDLPTLVVGSVAIAPDGTWFACTGDQITPGTAFTGLGIYRSTDGGRRWRHVAGNIPDETRCARIVFDSLDARLGWAATSAGLYVTRDGGDSWADAKLPYPADATGPFDRDVSDVVVRKRRRASDPVEVLAAVGWRGGGTGAVPGRTGRGNGLYRSSDGGAAGSFVRLGAAGFAAPGVQGRVALATVTGEGQMTGHVWAVVSNRQVYERASYTAPAVNESEVPNPAFLHGIWGNTLEGVYSSNDFGHTWTRRADTESLIISSGGESTLPGVQTHFNQVLALDPANTDTTGAPTRVVLGLEDLYVAEATGTGPLPPLATFRPLTTCGAQNPCPEHLIHIDQHAALFLPGPDPWLLVGSDGGAYRQRADQRLTNGGFGRGQNAEMRTLIAFGAAMTDDGVIYQGLQDNGTAVIESDGSLRSGYGGDGTKILLDPRDPKVAYGAMQYGLMYVTDDAFHSTRLIAPPVDHPLFHMPMALDPLNPDRLLMGGQDIELSESGPATTPQDWTTVFDLGTPGQVDAHQEGNHNVASALEVRDGQAYAGWCGVCDPAAFGGTFSSGIATNVGGSWHHAAARGLPERMVTDIAIDAANPRRIWVTLGGYSARWTPTDPKAAGKGHLFVSDDAGETFRDVSANLPDAPAYSVLLAGREIFVATRVGAFVSDAAEPRFTTVAPGLPNAPVADLQLTPDRTRMVAATAGRGSWWVDLRVRNIASPPKASTPKKKKLNCSKRAIRKLKGSKAKGKRKAACKRAAARRKAAAKRRKRPRG